MDKFYQSLEKGENVNLLTEEEWRIIHNALAIYQLQQNQLNTRTDVQSVMDKVRDYYIAPYVRENTPNT